MCQIEDGQSKISDFSITNNVVQQNITACRWVAQT